MIDTPPTAAAGPRSHLANSTREDSKAENLYHGTNEATAQGNLVVQSLQSGYLAAVDAGVRTFEATLKFGGDIEAVTAFLAPLVEAKVFSPSEARLGFASPKLSKLRKIGEYADRLRRREIVRYCLEIGCSGATLIFQIAVLLDQFPGDNGAQELVDRLRDEKINTRQGMLRLTRDLKRAKDNPNGTVSDPIKDPQDEPEPDIDQIDSESDIGRRYDLILAVPKPIHLRKLSQWLGDDVDGLPRCLLDEDLSYDAIFVAVARLSDLAVIKDRLLPRCGINDRDCRVLLTRRPNKTDVTDAQVMIVAENSSRKRTRLLDLTWLADDDPGDPETLADRLVPDAQSKLRLFASETTGDWWALGGTCPHE